MESLANSAKLQRLAGAALARILGLHANAGLAALRGRLPNLPAARLRARTDPETTNASTKRA
jgi:hypothetical protein